MTEQSNTKATNNPEKLLTLLQNFSNFRTGQDQVLWSIIGSFWTTNSLLLVSIFATDREDRLYVGMIISFVGIWISWLWNRIQSRTLKRLERYEGSIITIERRLGLEYEICSHLQENSEEYLKNQLKNPSKKTARYAMRLFSGIAFWSWIIAFVGIIFYAIFFNSNPDYLNFYFPFKV